MLFSGEWQTYSFVDSWKVYGVVSCKPQICIYSINFKALFKQLHLCINEKMQNKGKCCRVLEICWVKTSLCILRLNVLLGQNLI